MKRTYRANVERDGRFWLVRVPEVGVTQARHLREVELMARDLIALVTDTEPSTFNLDVEVQMPAAAKRRLDRAVRLRNQAKDTQAQAAEELRAAAQELAKSGMTVRDIGQLLGVSYQRAHQLVSSGLSRAS
ncbi:MAG TPA: HicB family toxin-antitoxin system [Mycobacteriales bacterium]|nr:HicB family toxin-antitoxin system [Mycobacteriales bacterium]